MSLYNYLFAGNLDIFRKIACLKKPNKIIFLHEMKIEFS